MSSPKETRTALGCLVAFSLPLCAVGLVAAFLVARELAAAPRDWREAGFLALFAVVFGGAGVALIAMGRLGARTARRRAELAREHPGKPWMLRDDWARGEARCRGKHRAVFAWGFTIFWILVSLPAVVMVPDELRKGNWPALLALVFPLAGIWLLVWAIRLTARWRKFGQSVFELGTLPGRLGGRLAGVVRPGVKIEPRDGFRLRLSCLSRRRRRNGETSQETVLWQEEQVMARELLEHDPRATAIPACFEIPSDAGSPTREEPGEGCDGTVRWALEVEADLPGHDYHAEFEVPVFRVEPEAEARTVDADPAAAYRSDASAPEPATAGIEVIERGGGETELIFRAGRNRGAALGVSIFAALFAGAAWLQIVFGAPLLFPIVTALFTLLLGLAAMELWFNVIRCRFDSRGIAVTSSTLGLGSTRSLEAGQVSEIRLATGMRSGDRTLYYDIEVVPVVGRRFYAGRHIRDKELARSLVERIATAVTPCPQSVEV